MSVAAPSRRSRQYHARAVTEAGTIGFELARFEHLVETQRGHIVRVSGTWLTPEGRDLPHPTLVAGEGDDAVSVAPLPIPGQDPPHADGSTLWLASYSIPKRLFEDGAVPQCRLQPAPDVLVELPPLAVPEPSEAPLTGRRPAMLAPDAVPLTMAPPQPLPAEVAPAARAAGGKGVRELFVPAIRAHRLLVLAVVAVALVGSVVGLIFRSPSYAASASVLVTPLPRSDSSLQGLPELRASSDPAQTVDTVAQLVRTNQAATATAKTLGGGWTMQKVLDRVKVAPRGQTNVLEVRATADGARFSARLANTFARTSLAQRDQRLRALAVAAIARTEATLKGLPDPRSDEAQAQLQRLAALQRVRDDGDPTLQLIQPAAVPRSAGGLPPAAVIALTALAGLVIAIAAAALMELLGPGRIETDEELQELYPLPVLARLPALSRRRRRPEAPELREALRTLQVQLEMDDGRHRAIMLTSASTGDGKTTTAIAFALELAASGRQVILVDLDLRKPDLARRLGVQPQHGIQDLVAGRGALADMLVDVPTGSVGSLQLLAPAGETTLPGLEAVVRELPGIVDGATALADYVVLDTPPAGEVSDALAFARAVEDVLIVTRLGQTRRPAFESMREQLDHVGLQPAGLLVIGGAAAAAGASRYPVATGDFSP
jgi:Mrp family chromosome partitioning ATPase/capsular polysaccharide biosynthesis protein